MESAPGRKVCIMTAVTHEKRLTWLALFASLGTVICCALPIAFVSLGFGAAVAAFSSRLPFLVTLTMHKAWVFAASGALLAVSGWLMFRPGRACRTDLEFEALCEQTRMWNRRIFWVSVAVWGLGFFAACLALPLRLWLGI